MLKRFSGIFFVFIGLFTLLVVRICYLSTFSDLTEVAQNQSGYTLNITTQRGGIYDRNFNNMVNNSKEYYAVVMPDASSLDNILSLNQDLKREEVIEQIQAGKPFLVKSSVASIDDDNIKIFPSTSRYNSNGIAEHIIGYLDGDGVGVSGIEKAYDDLLQNYTAKTNYNFTLDGAGRMVMEEENSISVEGDSSGGVVLTLDYGIQEIVEKVASNYIDKGAVLILDASSAEILACASFPKYSQTNVAASLNDENLPLINRNLYAYSVGSTFKICTAAAALESGISAQTTYYCSGQIKVGDTSINCHFHQGHGYLNMEQAMAKSCNPYYINLGLSTGGSAIRQMAYDLGFGKEIVLADTITAAAGTLPSEEQLNNSKGETANFSFGQGQLTANTLQVSQLILSVLNGGKVIEPSLVLGTTEDGKNLQPSSNETVPTYAMSEESADQIKGFLIEALEQQESNDAKPGFTTGGGKSATAQTGSYDDEGNEIYQTWYAGFFPADQPKYVAVILVEGGTSGTASAAPIFAKLADAITLYQEK